MIWALKDAGVSRPKDLPERIERRLQFSLSRFAGWIDKVVVFLHDHNGPKGGVDKVCRVLVKARGCGVIMAAVADADWRAAVDRAAATIGRNVARQVRRRRDGRRTTSTRPARPAEPARGG